MSRNKPEKVIDDAKRFAGYKFVELVEKRTSIKHRGLHAHRLLRSLGFVVKKTPQMAGRVPSREELETWPKED